MEDKFIAEDKLDMSNLMLEKNIIKESKIIEYSPRGEFYKSPFGAARAGTQIAFKAGISRDMGQVKTKIVIINDETKEEIQIEGKWHSMIKGVDYYEFKWTPKQTGLYFYYIKATTGKASLSKENLRFEHMTKKFQQTVYEPDFCVPKWLGDGIMYQIFPDRFNRSRKYTPPQMNKDYILRDDWGAKPVNKPDSHGVIRNNDFFGGNLIGIQEKLPYLANMGVSVIYLNPITQAYSNHRYDTADYKNVDPMLGTNEDFKNLCQKALEEGIRIIVDGVFNHTGDDSIYFNKYRRYDEADEQGELGAYNSKDSKYYKWYTFSDYPNKYESWWGIDTLPNVKEEDQSYLDYIIRDKDSVINHWLNLGASGFRLDVADELPDIFLEEFRKGVKTKKPESVIIGEVWEDASNKISYNKRRKYLHGKQLDSVMNYPFKKAIRDFLETKDAKIIADVVESLQENYPQEAFYSLMNILGTHDTQRILTTLLKQDPRNARKKLLLAVVLWAFLPGTPCIYYGDEIGMMGEGDPLNRGCFQFEKRDEKIYSHYMEVLSIRKKAGSMSEYKYRTYQAKDALFAFTREKDKNISNGKFESDPALESDTIFVAVNTGDSKTIKLPFKKIKTFFQIGSTEIIDKDEIKLESLSAVIITGLR